MRSLIHEYGSIGGGERLHGGDGHGLLAEHQTRHDDAFHFVISTDGPLEAVEREAEIPAEVFDTGETRCEDVWNGNRLHKRQLDRDHFGPPPGWLIFVGAQPSNPDIDPPASNCFVHLAGASECGVRRVNSGLHRLREIERRKAAQTGVAA